MTEAQSENPDITADELRAASGFVGTVNNEIRSNGSMNPMSQRTALKFLIARKFDIDRAIELYQQHEITRLREGLSTININDENFKAEINSGKFTILKRRDPNNATIAVFTAKLHQPDKSNRNLQVRDNINRYTLQGIVYQLDAALEDISTQRNGIVFIHNMSESDFSNFDLELCEKILNLLKGAYPAKLKKVLVVAPPIWFKFAFQVLSVIVKKKLRERVELLSMNQLQKHIPPESLTPELGGFYHHNHQIWLQECEQHYGSKNNDLCDLYFAQSLVNVNNNDTNNSLADHNLLSHGCQASNINSHCGPNDSRSQVYDYGNSGLSLEQFIEMIKNQGEVGLSLEYESIINVAPAGTFEASNSLGNKRKNRYVNIKCYDHTRVVLEPYDLPDNYDMSGGTDYINANFVDGYRQPKAYISTQGPTESTLVDFWRMIWQTGSRVIVMLTPNYENGLTKCDNYWPTKDSPTMIAGLYKIELINQVIEEDYIPTCLKLTNTRSEVSRDIWHMQFIAWPDFGTPATSSLLNFRQCVLKKQLDAIELTGSSSYPPIVVHCSAGIGRSGTFIAIDISIQKLEATGLVDIRSVVELLRAQRFLSVQTRDQYTFCFKSVYEYATSSGLIDTKNELDYCLY